MILKRCPFCGSRRVSLRSNEDDDGVGVAFPLVRWVQCDACDACGPTGGTAAGATDSWDHRYRGDGERERRERAS